MEETGKKIQRMGCLLTGLITLPIIGSIAGGPAGLVIGLLIGGLIAWASIKGGKDKASKHTWRTITINAKPTKRFTQLVATDVSVAGISYRQEVVPKLIAGSGRKIILERDPDNEYSENKSAIKAMARWKEGEEEYIEHVGYVPRDIAAEIAEEYPYNELLGCLSVIYTPGEGSGGEEMTAGIRFDIYAAPEEN